MRKFAASIGVLLFCFSCYAVAQDAGGDWVKFRQDSFTALFPGEPTLSEPNEPHVRQRIWSYAVQGQRVFLLGCADYDAKFDLELELAADRDNFLKGVHAQLVTSKRTDFERVPHDKLPALEFTGENPDFNFKGLVIADGQRVYFLAVGGRGNLMAATEKFLGSFSVVAP